MSTTVTIIVQLFIRAVRPAITAPSDENWDHRRDIQEKKEQEQQGEPQLPVLAGTWGVGGDTMIPDEAPGGIENPRIKTSDSNSNLSSKALLTPLDPVVGLLMILYSCLGVYGNLGRIPAVYYSTRRPKTI